MYLPTAIDKQHPAVYAAGFLEVLIPLYYVSWQYQIAHAPLSRVARPPSDDFVGDWFSVHLVEPFDPSAVGAYCNTTEWRPNLVFNLANANGGIGNVRGNILDFLFFAIEAGASIMLPGMASRSQTDISNVWASRAPFDLFFDEAWFLDAMSEACPQMTIYKPSEGQELTDAMPGNYLPQTRRMDASLENTRTASRAHLDSWLATKPTYSPENITLVNLERTLWDIDTRSLPPPFRRNFPQTLRTNPSIRRLALRLRRPARSNRRTRPLHRTHHRLRLRPRRPRLLRPQTPSALRIAVQPRNARRPLLLRRPPQRHPQRPASRQPLRQVPASVPTPAHPQVEPVLRRQKSAGSC